MTQHNLQVYDPPMCCSSGMCGPKVDPELVRFSSDLDWLKQQGVEVQRFNLASHPAEFERQECVREALAKEGDTCLPLIAVVGEIVSRGVYPSRDELMTFVGIGSSTGEQQTQNSFASSTSDSNGDDAPPCGPGCNCNAPASGKRMKRAISLLVLAAVMVPLLYLMEIRTRGHYLAEAMRSANPHGPRGYALLPGFRAEIGAFAAIAANPRSASVLVEFFLLGPRLVIDGSSQRKLARRVQLSELGRAGNVIAALLRRDSGLETDRLLSTEESLDDLMPTLAYLAFYRWIGVGEDWQRVWLHPDGRRVLEARRDS